MIQENIHIEKATLSDYQTIASIEDLNASSSETDTNRFELPLEFITSNSLSALQSGIAHYFIIKRFDIIMGGGGYIESFDFINGKYIELQSFYMNQEYNRKDLMSKIYYKIEELVLENGVSLAYLNCHKENKSLKDFYRNLGFCKLFSGFKYPGLNVNNMPQNSTEYDFQRLGLYNEFYSKNSKVFENHQFSTVNFNSQRGKEILASNEILSFVNLLDQSEPLESSHLSQYEEFVEKNSKEKNFQILRSIEVFWILDAEGEAVGLVSANFLPHFFFGCDQGHCKYIFVRNDKKGEMKNILEFAICWLVKMTVEERGSSCLDFDVKIGSFDKKFRRVFKKVGLVRNDYPVFGKGL